MFKKFLSLLLCLVILAGAAVPAGASGSPSADPTPKEYTITFDPNGGKFGSSTEQKPISIKETEAYSVAISKVSAPTKDGYSFVGWGESKTATDPIDSGKSPTTSHSLYAIWTAKRIKVIFDYGAYRDEALKNNLPESKYVTFGDSLSGVAEDLSHKTLAGYTYAGWYTTSTFTPGSKIETETKLEDYKIIKNDQLTIYARWLKDATPPPSPPVSIDITYNYNYSSVIADSRPSLPSTETKSLAEGALFNLSAPTGEFVPTGYTFDGWYTPVNHGTEKPNNGYKIPSSLKVGESYGGEVVNELVAHWKIKTPTVSYDIGYTPVPSDAPKPTTVPYGTDYNTLLKPDPTRVGYDFLGWFIEDEKLTASSTGKVGEAGIIIKARWNAILYTISFDNNYGTLTVPNPPPSNPSNATITYGKSFSEATAPDGSNIDVTTVKPDFIPDGYRFAGWYTSNSPSASDTPITASTRFTSLKDVQLYAKWEVKPIIVSFNLGYSTPSPSPIPDYEAVKNSKIYDALPSETPLRSGWVFDGWYTKDGKKIVNKNDADLADNEANFNLIEATTVYAHWKQKEYTVKFDYNYPKVTGETLEWYDTTAAPGDTPAPGATPTPRPLTTTAPSSPQDAKMVYGESFGSKLPGVNSDKVPVKPEGYKNFSGWFTEPADTKDMPNLPKKTGEKVTSSSVYSWEKDSVTLYARWLMEVKFDANGGTFAGGGTSATKNYTIGSEYGSFPAPPSKNDEAFMGWTTRSDEDSPYLTADDIATAGLKTLYAQYGVRDCEIKLDPNGGELPSSAKDTLTITFGSPYGVLPTPTRTGYSFNGWYKSATPASGEAAVTSASIVDGDRTLYAVWTPAKYKITFNLNYDNAPTPTVKEVNYDSLLGEAFPSPEPTRKNFLFNGWYTTAAGTGTSVSSGAKVTADMTLYAQWRPSGTVGLDPQGGQMPEGAQNYLTVLIGEKYPVLPTPTRTGYSFSGWYTSPEGGGKRVNTNDDVAEPLPAMLYASWTASKITVSFDFGGSGGSHEPKTLSYGDTYGALPLARWDGRSFIGWFTAKDDSGKQVNSETKVDTEEDHTLYAHWGYTISFEPGQGSGTMENDLAPVGGEYTLPECTMTPPTGMVFYRWAIDSVKGEYLAAGQKHTFTRNTTLYAIWTDSPVRITATSSSGGTLATSTGLDGQIIVEKGADLSFIATPERGYKLVDLQIDGNSYYAMRTYTFRDLQEDHTIHAIFEIVEAKDYLVCPRDSSCPLAKYKDLYPDNWYHDAIHYCLDELIMNGSSDTSYNPNQKANRAMLAMMLWRSEGCPNPVGYGPLEKPFKDVSGGDWFYKAVLWASKEKVVEGYSNGKFGPNDLITREQVVTMLWRYSGNPAPSATSRLPFYDAWAVHDYAWDAMCWATENGIMNGRTDGTLDPRGNASRAEIAQIFMNYLEGYANS